MYAAGIHFFWITSRAAGTAALVLSSVSVSVGLLMGGRFVKGRGLDLRITHEVLSLSALVAIGVHGVSLLGDSFMHPSLLDISVPFVSGYQTLWTSLGIVAGWSLAVLGLSFYARDRIGRRRWRVLHRFTALAWVAGLVHSLGEGTDAGTSWFLAMTTVVAAPALGLLAARMIPARDAPDRAAPSAPPTVTRGRAGRPEAARW